MGGQSIVLIGAGGEAPAAPRPGGFDRVESLALPPIDGTDPLAALTAAVGRAEQMGVGWMTVLGAGEALADDAFELVEPSLDLFDAVFGAAHVRGSREAVSRPTRLAFDTADRLPHALLHWWLPASHLIRVATARRMIDGISGAGRIAYLFDLWNSARCLKSAQPLLVVDGDPAPIAADERDEVLRRLAQTPVFIPVQHGEAVYHLPYTGLNAGIEREQTRGLFFEAMELEELKHLVRPGARIVDVGANTGNHTVFFAGPMRAGQVTPLEPLPGALAALRAAVARNGLSNVDLGHLGIGISDRNGRARLVSSARGGLGATSLEADSSGDIVVAPLDSVISGPVDFLKVDVEGMEMAVLAGAESILARCRPMIFIEIANANTRAFSAWLSRSGYDVVRVFTDKGHANYLLRAKDAG